MPEDDEEKLREIKKELERLKRKSNEEDSDLKKRIRKLEKQVEALRKKTEGGMDAELDQLTRAVQGVAEAMQKRMEIELRTEVGGAGGLRRYRAWWVIDVKEIALKGGPTNLQQLRSIEDEGKIRYTRADSAFKKGKKWAREKRRPMGIFRVTQAGGVEPIAEVKPP